MSKTHPFTLRPEDELIVDNFAGGGGASTGIFMALGRHVDIAVNHDRQAVALHQANHPETRHFCEDVFKIDPRKVTGGRRVGLGWFSPDCKHFSKAKGGKPRSRKIRGLAWVAVKWAASFPKGQRPRVIILENVEEFQDWGPLLPNGNPCPERKGKSFQRYIARLRNLDYDRIEWRELRGCDYGAPTIRKRLFIIARCDGQPIVWPEPTHGDPESKEVLSGQLRPWKTAADCIDWSIPCHSIFLTKEEAKKVGVRRPLADATMRRIAKGMKKFVLDNPRPFIVPLTHQGSDRVEDILEPMRTVTGAHRGERAIVTPYGMKFRFQSEGMDLQDPLPTVTAGSYIKRPAGAGHAMGIAVPILTECANGSAQRNFNIKEPLRTQCAQVKGGHFALVNAFLAKHYGGNESPGAPLVKPFDTVTARDHHALTTAHVVRHFGQSVGSETEEPVGTVTAGGGGKTGIVASSLMKMYGTSTGQSVEDPLHTITGQGLHFAETRAFLQKYYGEGGQDQDITDPMHTLTTKSRMGLVTVMGEQYQIVDIGMRMLKPRELYRAQGFPEDYVINLSFEGKPLSEEAQVRMCGNSVCPPVAAALVLANVPEMSIRPRGANELVA